MPDPSPISPNFTPQRQGLVIGVADLMVSSDPEEILVTYALGSCLGITLHDPGKCIGGLLHVMLPDSGLHRQAEVRPAMFLDTGLPLLLENMLDAGADRSALRCKVFGGAQLLSADQFFCIGEKNVDACYKITAHLGLRVQVWEVSGCVNRTIRLSNQTGDVRVRVPARPEFVR